MIKNEQGDALNRNGKYVPTKSIDRHLIARDRAVSKIMQRVLRLEKKIKSEKAYIKSEVDKFINRYTDGKDVEGNIQLSDYANLNLVVFRKNDIIHFDERLNSAKVFIDKCLKKWSSDANENLRGLVNEAFNVDKKGRVNTYMVLRLTRLKSSDPDWIKAIKLINESIEIAGTRNYMSFKRRISNESEFESINLNFKDA